MKTRFVKSLAEMDGVALEWLEHASKLRPPKLEAEGGALVVGLSGNLGAGKTAFVKLVARHLGIEEEVTSPTFVIMKIYGIDSAGADSNDKFGRWPWKRLVHIDAYRLEKKSELEALGWENLVSDPDNLIMMEWPENVETRPPIGAVGVVGAGDKISECRIKFELGKRGEAGGENGVGNGVGNEAERAVTF